MYSWFSFYFRYLYEVKSWIFCFIFGSRTLERQYPTRRRQIYGQYRAARWQGNSNLNNLLSRQLKFSHRTINKTSGKSLHCFLFTVCKTCLRHNCSDYHYFQHLKGVVFPSSHTLNFALLTHSLSWGKSAHYLSIWKDNSADDWYDEHNTD